VERADALCVWRLCVFISFPWVLPVVLWVLCAGRVGALVPCLILDTDTEPELTGR
jgi:hypothetical protein